MRSSKVAKRYARAMLGLSNDHAQLESWGEEIQKLASVLEAPDAARAFASPEISPVTKLQVLEKIAERLEVSYPMRSFAAVVARHSRIEDLPPIAEAYRRMLDDLMGRARATLIFAQPPQDDELARVLRGLEAIAHKKIIPTVQVDTRLIGGVIAELEGKTYDGSLANRLTEAARRLAS